MADTTPKAATPPETHADAAGLVTTGWKDMNADGDVTEGPTQSPGEIAIATMGKPVHVHCCPTGTVEFGGDQALRCDAVSATVAALTRQLSVHPPKILILYGSLRKASASRKVAVEAGRILATYGADVHVFDPEGLPLFSTDADPTQPKPAELRRLTRWCEGMVWISPEIHGNISGVFKNQIDWIPLSEGAVRPTQGKTVAVMQVEAGSQSFNTVNNLRVLGRWMRCVVIPNQASIPQAYNEFDEDGTLKDTPHRGRVVDVVDELFKYTLLLRDQQPYLLERYSEKKADLDKHLKACNSAADATTLKSLQSPTIIDVRSGPERESGAGGELVSGSIHVPLNVDRQPQSVHETTAREFRKMLEAAGVNLEDKEAAFITHCKGVSTDYIGRGARAAALLRSMGYLNSHNGGSPDDIRAARAAV